ncbi:MAG: S-layer homology domain-containing protein [Clostridiales bacterium]|jgi:transglutaminase-like putative cysteine protease|nr:S-layer homology domain-containing protein [Clostridiales bacterium]
MNKKRILSALICFLLLLSLPAQANVYSRGEPLTYVYRQRYIVENRSSQASTDIELTIPAMFPDPFSNQFILDTHWSRQPARLYRDERGNLTAIIIIPRLEPGARTEIIQEYRVRNFTISFDLTSPGASYSSPHPSYLQPESKVESNHRDIIAKAREITAGKVTDVEKARAIFAFVQQYMTYGGSYRNMGALSALTHRSGVCEDYAALFVALCRASGIPARMVYGEGSTQIIGGFYGHAWAEFFLPTHGWVPVEPTVTSKEVPWRYFAALPGDYRHIIFGLTGTSFSWKWRGGQITVSSNLTVTEDTSTRIFSDLDTHWARTEIIDLAFRGIVTAEQGRFEPGKAMTRGEAARLLVLAQGITPIYGPSVFTDVKSEDLFHPYIQAAAKAGIFAGFEDGTFRPNDRITREQMAAVLSRIKGYNGGGQNTVLTFTDSHTIAPWALSAVQYSVGAGLFGGDDQNRFRPKDTCSRAEAAVLIHRLLSK